MRSRAKGFQRESGSDCHASGKGYSRLQINTTHPIISCPAEGNRDPVYCLLTTPVVYPGGHNALFRYAGRESGVARHEPRLPDEGTLEDIVSHIPDRPGVMETPLVQQPAEVG